MTVTTNPKYLLTDANNIYLPIFFHMLTICLHIMLAHILVEIKGQVPYIQGCL